jgi:hypothetical protein
MKEIETIRELLFADWKHHKYYLYMLGFYDLEMDSISVFKLSKVNCSPTDLFFFKLIIPLTLG